jgi:ornithine cyclodeaminase/alanine dehydrogenase-like protein (mu-crystallin family)
MSPPQPPVPDDSFLYLSRRDVEATRLAPDVARAAVIEAFRALNERRAFGPPKQIIDIASGHSFQVLISAWREEEVAAAKWLGVAPVTAQSPFPGINAIIALNDFETGRLVAIMDGDTITGLRTAAMSAAAAQFLARADSATLGIVGCGLQARFHLPAMRAALPALTRLTLFSRTRASALALAQTAEREGWQVGIADTPEALVRGSDVVVTTVPMATGFAPFLHPDWLRPGSFVSAVDIGRSWLPGSLRRLDLAVTDDHAQQAKNPPLSADLGPAGTFDADLGELAAGVKPGRTDDAQRAIFIFRGVGLADLAVAVRVHRAAAVAGIGVRLPR